MNTNVVSAFSVEDVERLTGVSAYQLRYWDRTKFFTPGLAADNRRESYSRVYTFRDVLCLKVLNTIRNEVRVPLPHLREVKDKLAHLGDDLWTKVTLYVLNRTIVFYNPETQQKEEVVSGQGVLQIPLKIVRTNMEQAVKSLWARDAKTIGRIDRKRGVAGNKPVIAGTRIPVRAIKDFHDAGYSTEQIRRQYPDLTAADIESALAYKKKGAAA